MENRYYHSTRGSGKLSPKEAVLRGIADDGGLYVWDGLEDVRLDLDALLKLDYQEMAKRLFAEVLWDYSEEELARCVDLAYTGKFDSEQITPLVMAGDLPVLELFHGPTSAFKDVALCMLPQLMSTALNGRKEKVMIVTATSGDTGKAALSGFQDAENIGITVFYPYGKVSDIQRLQMVCQQGENVRVCAIRGNFDDAQSGVKRLFHSAQVKAALDEDHIVLSSANSINIGRLVPQIVYYFAAYRQLLEAGAVQMGEEVNFCVPTGNFGNVLAGYYAKLMGLPVHRLIVAANENNVLEDFLNTGVYDRNRPFHQTISPSMDILISSNLERMLYYLSGKDSVKVAGWMKDLAEQERLLDQIEQQIAAAAAAAAQEGDGDGGASGFIWPCPSSHRITSNFGPRPQPTAGASTNHKGIDIGAGYGSAIVASASGRVTTSTYSSSAGNYIVISHGNGMSTVYMHCSALYVSVGQMVSQGETIAAVGSTGYSTGNHLHFGVIKNGTYVNPLNYVG